MFFSYRARRALRHILPVLLVIVILLLLAVIGWLLWIQRFMVYTQQGARLDFSLQLPASSGIAPQQPLKDSVVVEYPDGETLPTQPPDVPEDPDLPEDPVVPPVQSGIEGYYLDAGTVQKDPDGVRQQLEQLPAGTTVMLQLANFWGYRYYSSEYGTQINEADRKKMDDLVAWMADRDLHIVGRLPAFRDYFFVESNSNLGLKKANGYTWTDPDRSYWTNPANERVLTRLTQIMRELRNLGFDEVVFDDFYFPESEDIAFSGDRKETIYRAAETLVVACATEDFTVSFVTADYDFRVPEGKCRLYVNAEPTEVQDVLAQIQVADKATQVVFFCSTYDDRFDGCSVIRPYALLQ